MDNHEKETLQQYAYNYLKNQILSDKFNYDSIYSETKLAKEIGISRTPMRAAIHRLSQEKLIDTLPSKGFTLHKFTQSDIIEVFQMRSAIEGFCTVVLTRESSTDRGIETINKLKSILSSQQEILYTTKNICEFVEYDTLFHSTIVDYVGNTEFIEMFNNYIYRIKKLAKDSLSYPDRMEAALKEHYDIINCIESCNLDKIYFVTITHMNAPKDINLNSY